MSRAWIKPADPAPAVRHLTESALKTISRWLADDMNKAVENGANAVSMPDELVEIAAWIATHAPVLTRDHVMSAMALCPTDLSHSKRCEWIAEALNKATGQEGKL
jgi:hypothetical protein